MEFKEWQKPITTRRYLHGPLAERVVTLWSEGKVVLGEVETLEGPRMPEYETLVSCGIWPVFGKDLKSLDFKTVQNIMMKNGIPVHSLKNTYENLEIGLEAFCDIKRKSTVFFRVKIKNNSDNNLCEQIGFLLRTGFEKQLVFDAPDLYKSYAPDVEVWKNLPATWKKADGEYRDGEYFLCTSGEFEFDENSGLLFADITLGAGEETVLDFILGKGSTEDYSYDEIRENVIKFYENQLKRITNLPDKIKNDKGKCELINNLVLQLLQCFTKPVGEDFVLCRQGGLQRRIWPYEALYALEALDKLGDFDDYIEPAIDVYFSKMQNDEGEIVPLGIYWAIASATVLYSFSDHAINKGSGYFRKYREKAIKIFEFIRKTRQSTVPGEGVMVGLYPPKQSCDCELVFQSWTFTDTMNLIGLQKFMKALEFLNDSYADEVREEINSYTAVLNECFENAKKLTKSGQDLRLTSFVPSMPGDETLFAFSPFTGLITQTLKVNSQDVDSLITDMKKRGRIHEGLYWRMPEHYYRHDEDGIVRMWYTVLDDYYWFETFLRLERYEEAQQVIDSTLKYSVTEEGYMLERYHERDPYFCPWSPNASANGRLILMLLAMNNI